MIIWGGHAQVGGVVERATGGAVYDPATDHWRPLAEPDGTAPVAESVAWTGDSLWVWGGSDGGERIRRGFVYDPASGESRIITTETPEAAVQDADAVALDGKVLLTGGKTNFPDAHPLVYDLAADTWSDAASPPPVPGTDGIGAPAFAHNGVAFVCNATQARCGSYAFASDSWQSLTLSAFEAPFTYWPAWVLADDDLVFYGLVGDGSRTDTAIARAFNLDSKTWSALPSDEAPPPRRGQSATWTGTSLVFWGGATADGASAEDGWRLKWASN